MQNPNLDGTVKIADLLIILFLPFPGLGAFSLISAFLSLLVILVLTTLWAVKLIY